MKFFWSNINKETKTIKEKVDGAFIDASFKKVEKEIESLRKYDRGEKEIHAPDLRSFIPTVRESAR